MPTTQKRKKTADMPDSPPKRVTRARAKASDEPASKAKTVKVTTPSAKAAIKKEKSAEATTKGKAAEAPKITKRKTRADDEQPTAAVTGQPVEQPVKTRGRTKKVEEKAAEPEAMDEMPKKARGRSTKSAKTGEMGPTAPKTRGHPKMDQPPAGSKLPVSSTSEEPAKPKTRTRTASVKSNATKEAPARTANLKSAALKKKVTFQDEAGKDKENVPLEVEKPVAKATGLRAKPIRKPATAKASTRAKKAAPAKPQSKTVTQNIEVLPLSPKKVVQVAKSSSVSSEDELCSSKTRVRALSQSPVKPPASSARHLDTSVSKLDFGSMAVPSSPSKDAAPSILQSPARRPPSSPFKDAMKSSPKKMNLADGTPRPALLFPKDAVQSTMKDSPKRGIVPVALAQPVFLAKSPTKTSLLQSPARRPGVTPMKAFVQQSPTKSSAAKPFAKPIKSPKRSSPSKTPESSPQEAASSPLRAARTVQSPIKVHTITEADRVADAQTGSAKASSQGSFDFFIEASKRTPVTHVSRGFEEDPHDMMSQNGARSPSPSPIKHHPSAPIAAPVVDDSMPDEKEVRIPEERSTTPPGPIAFVAPAFSLASPVFRCAVDESDSEDELASPQKVFLSTPLHKHGVATQDFGAQPTSRPAAATRRSSHRSSANRKSFGMSPLAVQMSAWLASSPEKIDLSDSAEISQPVTSPTRSTFQESPAKTSFFEDQMVVCDGGNDTVIDAEMAEVEVSQVAVETSQESKSFEEYGDENVMPEGPQLEPQLVALQQGPQERTVTCTPAKVFYAQPREIHTVSKVPLRPAGDESPWKVPRKRSRSIGGPLASGEELRVANAPVVVAQSSVSQDRTPVKGQVPSKPKSPTKPRASNDDSLIETPRTLRKAGASKVLAGVVAYVDVHTSEGEDASGIFLELLTQMGARCVKQWSWNPRTSMAGFADGENSPGLSEVSNTKVGITHVVFKDGGKRTMEKVRESKGAVACVGVGWVLDCERENKWLDEADYAIDVSFVPRGGHRRRKSMEPRMLANINGNLVPAESPAKQTQDISPTKEFLTFSTPASRRDTFEIQPQAPETPIILQAPGEDGFDESPLSPTTPYYLSKGAQLVQQTCPPKQTQELLFPVSGRIEDQPDERMRQRLLMARRKSLQWVPKVSSPLGRAVSYGK